LPTLPRGTQGFPQKNVSQFGLTIWPAIANVYKYKYIYISKELYYKDKVDREEEGG